METAIDEPTDKPTYFIDRFTAKVQGFECVSIARTFDGAIAVMKHLESGKEYNLYLEPKVEEGRE